MDHNILYETLSPIPFGIILAWTIALASFLAAVFVIGKKIWHLIEKFFNSKAESDKKKEMIIEHERNIVILDTKVDDISDKLDAFVNVYRIQLRHSIVRVCEEALRDGFITVYGLQSLNDLYEIYSGDLIQGDTYATTLVKKVHKEVKVIFDDIEKDD